MMRGSSVFRGVPDFGRYVSRPRLAQMLDGAGGRMRMLLAPTGWGKTLAAADYARQACTDVVWIECGGDAATVDGALRHVLNALTGEGESSSTHCSSNACGLLSALVDVRFHDVAGDPASTPLLVVLDDVGISTEGDIGRLLEIHRLLRQANAYLLITSQVDAPRTCRTSAEVLTLGCEHMAIREDELGRLGDFAGAGDATDLVEMRDGCGGHPALLHLMMNESQARIAGLSGEGLQLQATEVLARLVGSSLRDHERRDLVSVALLKTGRTEWLERLGIAEPKSYIRKVSRAIPLVRVSEADTEGHRRFWIHDMAEEWLLATVDWAAEQQMLSRACHVLSEEGDHQRAVGVLLKHADRTTRQEWLLRYGQEASKEATGAWVLKLLGIQDVHTLMDSPELLVLWGELLLRHGRYSEALGRARAAYELGHHAGDTHLEMRSMHVWLDALERLDRHAECPSVTDRLLETARRSGDSHALASALASAARAACNVGDLVRAQDAIAQSAAVRSASSSDVERALTDMYAAVIGCLRTGAYVDAIGRMSSTVAALDSHGDLRALARGVLATVLLEAGRIHRATPLAAFAASEGDDSQQCAFAALPTLTDFAVGRCDEALTGMTEAAHRCIEHGHEYDLAVNRVNAAVLLRAAGNRDEALCRAERAYERLCVMDFMGFRRLAALEVAASLLARGDVAAARRRADAVVAEGFGANAYHALRAAMVLSVCDCRQGDFDVAVNRLAAHEDHVLSESSNWQIAMYVRAFPELLGVLAVAVGSDVLPVHMLDMVLPEHAERALNTCRPWMQPTEWRKLGRRLLGDAELSRIERRGGRPVCHVRMFGGLDVVLADRTVSAREWKKGKARVLFAMLVAKRGQDIAREQILEYLWPEMCEERARNNFYVVWSAMKAALMGATSQTGACPYLENVGGRCRIVRDAVRSDVDEFEETLAEARGLEAASDGAGALDAYARLSAVYRDDLLPGDVYDDWFASLRDRYRFDFADAMLRAAQILLERDDPCEALVYARRALHVDSTREDLYQIVLRCQIAAGQRSSAIDTFIQCRSRLADELGLDPSAETMALYQRILVMEVRPRTDRFGLS